MRSPGTPAARARRSSPSETDVHARPLAREQGQHGLVGIGLHREADERVEPRQRLGEDAVVPRQRRARVAVERRADLGREAISRSTSSAWRTPSFGAK